MGPSICRLDLAYLLVLFGFAVALWIPRFDGPLDLRDDASTFYVLGTSLAEGRGYRLLNEPGEIQAVQYPPLLPAFVAVHQLLLGTGEPILIGQALRYSFFVLFTLYVLAVYVMARQYLSFSSALLAGSISCFYYLTYYMSDSLAAELPFALATVLFVICNRRNEQQFYLLLTGAIGAVAFLLRTAGIALLVAWIAESLLARNRKQFVLRVAISLIPIVAWQGYIGLVRSGEEYKHPAYEYQRAAYQFSNVTYIENLLLVHPFRPELGQVSMGDIAKRVAKNLRGMRQRLGEAVSAPKRDWISVFSRVQQRVGVNVLSDAIGGTSVTILGFLVVVGVVIMLTRRNWIVPLYIGFSLAMISLTPWVWTFPRYLAPLTPFLALALVQLLTLCRDYTLRRCSTKWRPAGTIFLAVVVSAVLGAEMFTLRQNYGLRAETYAGPGRKSGHWLFDYRRGWPEFDIALGWLKDRAKPETIVATSAAHVAHLKTGSKAILPPLETDPDKVQRLLDSVPVDYVIVEDPNFYDLARRYALPAIERYPERWKLVYSVPGSEMQIFQRVPQIKADNAVF